MSGGYSDNTAKTGNFDGSFGELIDMGVTMIQTDYPFLLSSYLGELNMVDSCIIFYGDTQSTGSPHTDIVAAIEAEECETYYLFHVGDLTDIGTSPAQWSRFLEIEEDLITKGKFYPVIGNHELMGDGNSVYGVTEIVNGISEAAPYIGDMLGEYGWYVEDITDNLVFIGLNNGVKYEMSSFTNFCRQQEAVLMQALQNNMGKDVIVAYHAPAFPLLDRYSGDSCASNYWHPIIAEQALQGNKIVVISGHTHGLSYAKKEGVIYLESGAGNNGLSTLCRTTASEAGVDYWGACEITNGYYKCNMDLSECVAKDKYGEELFTVDLS